MPWANSREIPNLLADKSCFYPEVSSESTLQNPPWWCRFNNGSSQRVPKLRSLAKSVRSECHGCKRFTATPVTAPAPEPLPKDRTAVGAAFEVVGVDFAGPIR